MKETKDEFGENPTLPGSEDNHDHKELPRGSSIDRYLIVEPIGSGGMGAVYRAYDPKLNRGIALKILTVKQDDLEAAERAKTRLIREAQALAQLSHPNVVAVHDYGSFGDDVFIAMELVEGKTLDAWLIKRPQTPAGSSANADGVASRKPIKEILEVMTAAGRGLAAAHKAGLVHRDFKPGNVIIGDDGRVRVLDFGLARSVSQEVINKDGPNVADSEQSQEHKNPFDLNEISSDSNHNLLLSPLTHAGGVLGTPLYMAPEQHLGLKTDERTDQFGFCVVLYETLYGKRPFAAKTMGALKREVIRQHICIPPADTDVPAWLWQIIIRGLSKDPEDRYPSMENFLHDLVNDPEIGKRARRKKLALTSVIFFLTILTIGLGYYAIFKGSKVCSGADKKLAGIWNNEIRAKTRLAFAKTELSYSKDSFVRVAKRFDDYFGKWKTEYTETCEATSVRGEQSEEIMDLRLGCLNRHLRNAGALIKVLGEADKTVVAKSIQAVSSLSGFSNCNDVEALQSRIPPPKDEQTKNRVSGIREKLAEVEALILTGKYREALELATKLEKVAKAVNYKPIQAEVLYWLGSLLNIAGKQKTAEMTLYEAARVAAVSRYSLLAAKAMAVLVGVVGYHQARHSEGLIIGKDAEILLDVAGGDERVRLRLLNNQGTMFFSIGNFDRALMYYRMSLAINKKTLGPKHPNLAATLNNIGQVFYYQKEYGEALEYFNKSLQVFEKTLGPEHPLVAIPLSGIGNALVDKGYHNDSFKPLMRTVRICERKTCDPESHGQALFGFAQALLATKGDRARAIKLAKQAREIFGKIPKALKKGIEEVDEWLKKHDTPNRHRSSPAEEISTAKR